MPTKNPYSFKAKVVKRSNGKSAVASAAYQAGEKLTDERTGRRCNYSRRKGVVHSEILAPPNSPAWAMNRGALWNRAELAEKRKDAQIARKFILALPRQLDHEQRVRCAKNYIQEQFVDRGMIADFSVHLPDVGKNQDNHHLHLLATMREVGPEGFASEKNRAWNKISLLEKWREQWAVHVNRHLEAHGFEPTWDHRTLEEQGIDRIPGVHLGQAVLEMEQRGIRTESGDRALEIAKANRQLDELAQIEKEIQDEQRTGPREAGPQPAATNRIPRAATPDNTPANRNSAKSDGEHEEGSEKAPLTAPPKMPTRPTSRPMIPPQEGGPDMRQGNNNLARAFQAGIESRSRQKKWEEHRFMLLHPPARELTYSQIERRRDMAERWDWLRYPDDVRRRTVEASPQGGKALREIEERQRRASEAAQHREAEIREIQERLEGLRPFQILLKNRLGGELQAEEKALAKAEAEQKRLALDEKKLILSCPDDVVSQYRWRKEEEREKALVALLAREAKEIEAERRREADEAQARKERQAMRPVAKPQKTGGWVPPSPN